MFSLVLVALIIAVYQAKHRAGQARISVGDLHMQKMALLDEISVLQAEEAHLTRPERIASLAREYLGMAPVEPKQFAELADLNIARLTPLLEETP